MSIYVRKIEKAKWLQNDIENGADVSADAITNCTKTTKNTLSIWEIENETEIEKAVLAIIAAGEHLDTIDIVCIDDNKIKEKSLSIEKSPGATRIAAMIDQHRDIVDLDYWKLGYVSDIIVDEIKTKKVRRFSRGQLRDIIKNSIEKGIAKKEEYHPSIIEKVYN